MTAMVLVLQIERQILLTSEKNLMQWVFRVIMAVCMAIIGSATIDQIIFQDDIDKKKVMTLASQVNQLHQERTRDLRVLIDELDSAIESKEQERQKIEDEISKTPFIAVWETRFEKNSDADTVNHQSVVRVSRQIRNPKSDQLKAIDNRISELRKEKSKKEDTQLGLRATVEEELRSKTGFLDELDMMLLILRDSPVAWTVWGIWFLLLFGLELFILMGKIGDSKTDYDQRLEAQQSLHVKRIEILETQSVRQ